MAPISKVLARSQTGLEKSGANSTIRGSSSAGNVSIRKTPFGEEIFRSLCGLPLLFQRPKLDKVELSVGPDFPIPIPLFSRNLLCPFTIFGVDTDKEMSVILKNFNWPSLIRVAIERYTHMMSFLFCGDYLDSSDNNFDYGAGTPPFVTAIADTDHPFLISFEDIFAHSNLGPMSEGLA